MAPGFQPVLLPESLLTDRKLYPFSYSKSKACGSYFAATTCLCFLVSCECTRAFSPRGSAAGSTEKDKAVGHRDTRAQRTVRKKPIDSQAPWALGLFILQE